MSMCKHAQWETAIYPSFVGRPKETGTNDDGINKRSISSARIQITQQYRTQSSPWLKGEGMRIVLVSLLFYMKIVPDELFKNTV